MDNFDTTKYFLGKLCLNKHDYEQTGKSLRTMPTMACKSGRCLKCLEGRIDKKKEYARYINWLEHPKISPSVLDLVKAEAARYAVENKLFDTDRYYLGRLCPNGHEYAGTGKTLRELPSDKNGECVICHRERSQSFANNNKEYYKEYYKEYQEHQRYLRWLENPRISPTVAELVEREAKRYWQENRYHLDPEYRKRSLQQFKKRYYENPDYQRNRVRNYQYANPDKVKHWAKTRWDRIKAGSDGSIDRPFLEKLFKEAFFCPYCGHYYKGESDKTLDHIVSIARGGKHSSSNVIVCCASCNTKKGDSELSDWLLSLPTEHIEYLTTVLF